MNPEEFFQGGLLEDIKMRLRAIIGDEGAIEKNVTGSLYSREWNKRATRICSRLLRRSNINGIAGSKFKISVVTLVSVVTFSSTSLIYHSSDFWHAFQLGWLPRKPRSWSVTWTIEDIKGDTSPFRRKHSKRDVRDQICMYNESYFSEIKCDN